MKLYICSSLTLFFLLLGYSFFPSSGPAPPTPVVIPTSSRAVGPLRPPHIDRFPHLEAGLKDSDSEPCEGVDPRICATFCRLSCGQEPVLEAMSPVPEAPAGAPAVLEAYSLTYPLFSIPTPIFHSAEDRDFFFRANVVVEGEYGFYRQHMRCPSDFALPGESRCPLFGSFDPREHFVFSQERFVRGELYLLRHARWAGRPDDGFGRSQCWEGSVMERQPGASPFWLQDADSPSSPSTPSERRFPRAALVLGPQTGSAFFQHFVDRVWSKLGQVMPSLEADPEMRLIVHRNFQGHPVVAQMLEAMGFGDRVVFADGRHDPIVADEMLFTCAAPHYHPVTYQRVRARLGLDSETPTGLLATPRNVVLYLPRDRSRQVVNEAEVLPALERWAADHVMQLVVFHHEDYPELDTLMAMLEKVAVMVGPHGGAFYNHVFAPAGLKIVEFFPFKGSKELPNAVRWPESVWWPAVFSGHEYHMIPLVSPSGGGEITVPIDHLLRTMDDLDFE